MDVWLYSSAWPGVAIGLAQCKHWRGKRVGVDKIRKLRNVMPAKKVERGLFITKSTLTDDAMAFAKENGIDLLDVNRLLETIARKPRRTSRNCSTLRRNRITRDQPARTVGSK